MADIRLFFDVDGSHLVADDLEMRERPTVICLHGGPGLDHSSLRDPLAPLAEVAQVIYVDQRGHGRSDRGDPRLWSLAQWAQDLRDLIDALGIVSPIVLGTSFGGYVAMAYAIRYPTHPAKLILLSTAARGSGHPERITGVLEAFERLGGNAAREAARRASVERTSEAFDEYLRVCGPLQTRSATDPRVFARMIVNDELVPHFERAGGEGVMFDLTSELGAICCPTLVIGGTDDPITPIGEQEAIVRGLREEMAHLERFPGCGHGIWPDDAPGLQRVLSQFVCA